MHNLGLIIFNTTMISRSVGKSLKSSNRGIRDFKIRTFEELDKLVNEMDTDGLTEKSILDSIDTLCKDFGISFGQAQKAINVILKYHFYLTKSGDNDIKRVLHCPIDRVVLEKLLGRRFPLTAIDKEIYLNIQALIQAHSQTRLDYDTAWDEQHLDAEGLLF